VMAIEDQAAARWAVQFHPESILTAAGGTGRQVIANVLRLCRASQRVPVDPAGPPAGTGRSRTCPSWSRR